MLLQPRHFIIDVSDMERSLAFYSSQIGFPVKLRTPERSELHCGAITLVLRVANPAEQEPQQTQRAPAARRAYLEFEAIDVEQFYREMSDKGVKFWAPPELQSSGRKAVVFLDPDGLPITVVEAVR